MCKEVVSTVSPFFGPRELGVGSKDEVRGVG